MNRIDRLSAILVQLQSRSLIKANDIAERFEISLRTVYRDIRALEEAGIPIIGNPGIGYSLIKGFKLPPLMFTQAEAIAFLTAEKLVNELTDAGSIEHYNSGMDKIRAIMGYADKDILENVETSISVFKTCKSEIYKTNMLQPILQSVHKRKRINITYFSDYKQETSEREIEPIGIFFSRTNWYLAAFCLKRKDYRTFRIDRIETIVETEKAYTTQHPSLKNFMDNTRRTQNLEEIVIRLPKDKEKIIGDDKYYYGLILKKDAGQSVELTFLTFSIDKFAHWYLSFADIATIISSEKFKDKVRNIIQSISP
ncbi:YafY family protein [uncultured Bacteroides sp.]|uniref:helix-turn-helix transcriptional regulator n=1 Tax=uncultured Bacteroides sp. TaxID=162156 RepID=UPI002AAB873A|nr:YafY family protein [uncultured Bacteroides sp.]